MAWGVVLLALMLWFGCFAWPRLTLRATGGFNADQAIYELTKPPAWRDVEAALEELAAKLPPAPYPGSEVVLSGAWEPARRPALAEFIQYLELPELERHLEKLHELIGGSVPYRRASSLHWYCRHMCEIVSARVRWAANQQPVPFDRALRDIDTGLNLARMCYEHQDVGEILAAVACEEPVVSETMHLACGSKLSPGQLRELLAHVQDCPLPTKVPVRGMVAVWRLRTRQRLRESYVVGEDGNGWLDLASVAGAAGFGRGFGANVKAAMWRLTNLLSPVFYDLQTVERDLAKLAEAYAATADLPGPLGLAAVRAIEGRVHELNALHGPCQYEWIALQWPYELAMERLTSREAAKAIIALRIHQQEHGGRLPETLSELVPDPLPALPLDQFSFSGRPLVYRREGDGFLLYSVGSNGTDQGGDAGSSNEWRADPDHLFPEPRIEAYEDRLPVRPPGPPDAVEDDPRPDGEGSNDDLGSQEDGEDEVVE